MSRSIHENMSRRRARQKGDTDWLEIQKKLRIKYFVALDRAPAEVPAEPVRAAEIEFELRDESPSLFFPASIDDMRAVLGALPPGALDGIVKVRLEAGTQIINADVNRYDVLDPYLKRKSIEHPSRTYTPVLKGIYRRDTHVISIFGYAKAPRTELTVRQQVDLELNMLITLVHEVAHHFDRMRRLGRGRWRMDDRAKNERFAEAMAIEWGLLAIVPHMREKYGARADRVPRLIRHPRGTLKWRQGRLGRARQARRLARAFLHGVHPSKWRLPGAPRGRPRPAPEEDDEGA